MKNGRLQCKDIPTLPILRYVAEHGGIGCVWWESEHNPSVRNAMPPNIPDRLALAKMRNLIDKGLIDGCPCGCRGDFEITDAGRSRILELEAQYAKQNPYPDPWPERWSKEKLARMRADPIYFASQFIQEPLDRNLVWLDADDRSFDAIVDGIIRAVEIGVPRRRYVCQSEAMAKRVMDELRRRLGDLFAHFPGVDIKTP